MNYFWKNSWIIISLFLFFSCANKKTDSKDKNEKGQKPALSVEIFVTSFQEAENILAISGSIMASEDIELKSETSGRITNISFDEGAPINKGQLLVKIYDSDLQAQMKKIQLQIDLATDDESRKRKLLQINGISKEELEISQNKLNTLKADLELIKAQIAKTEIIAPFNGIIGLRYQSTGAYVTPSVIIATMQQINPVKLDFSVPEKYAKTFKKGDVINFTVEGYDKIFPANVFAIESKIDLATRTMKIRAIAQNNERFLIPGAFAKVYINIDKTNKAIIIPAKALIPILDGQKVFISKNGKAKSINVKIAVRNQSTVQISEGLGEKDSVIVSGLLQLKDGMKVKPLKSKK